MPQRLSGIYAQCDGSKGLTSKLLGVGLELVSPAAKAVYSAPIFRV